MKLDPRCPYCDGTKDPAVAITCHYLESAAAEHHDTGTHLDFGVRCGCGSNPWDAGLVATFCRKHACLTLSCRKCNAWAVTFAIRE